MATSQNGWSAYPGLALRPLVIGGVSFVPGIRDDDDVHTVLGYVLTQFHERVEPLRNPGCWGYSYRENRNDPNSLSNHSSGTAGDANAPAHPNGVPTSRTFTTAQIAEVHKILAEVDHAIRWGGDYTGTPDAMHFEVNVSPAALAVVARNIRESGDDMPYTEKQLTQITRAAVAAEVDPIKAQIDELKGELGKQKIRTLNSREAQKRILKRMGVADDKLDLVIDELQAADQ